MKRYLNFKKIFVVLVLLLALFLRFNNLHQRTHFDADQEWLATRATELLKGDLPLLGPVTSIGSFSIGPGFIYLWAFFSFLFSGAPVAGAYLSAVLGLLFLITLFLFTKYFIDLKVAYLVLFLAAISSKLIFWDQQPWAPSLFYTAQMLILAGGYISIKKQVGYLILAVGLVLAFQSHFGVILSFVSLLVYFLLVRPVKPKVMTSIATVAILFVGFLPNLVFDLSHNFINLKKLFEVFRGDSVDYFISLNKVINVLNSSATSLIYPKNTNLLDTIFTKGLFALVLVNAFSLLRDKKLKNLSLLLLTTALLPAILFYLQQGKFSEYYLLMSVPSLILLLALFLKRLISYKMIVFLIIIISVYFNFKQIDSRYVSWNLKAKENIAQKIVEIGGTEGYGISINSKRGDRFGFEYIFDYYQIKADVPPKIGETRIFSVAIPQGFEGIVGTHSYDGIGLLWSGI
ncbi:MAG: hypothetical protein QY322_01800 [bacterium]|nr:MAG: hypothetical protein QY322_01800 [bacterium]